MYQHFLNIDLGLAWMGGNNLDYSKPIKYYLKDFLSRQALSSRFLPRLNNDADWKRIVGYNLHSKTEFLLDILRKQHLKMLM